MEIELFADERKRINGNWDYIGLLAVPRAQAPALLADLRSHRSTVGFDGQIKFGDLHSRGIGTRLDTAMGWLRILMDDAANRKKREYFCITGIDNSKLDYHLFGNDGSPKGKYANVYNRFFRASLLGLLRYCFPYGPIGIKNIYHDSEGNLQDHEYFDWHVIQQVSKEEPRVTFGQDRVVFVRSDPRMERVNPDASELIQYTDLILGTVTHTIQVPNRTNEGQMECAKLALPFIREILSNPYKWSAQYDQLRRFSISHFPRTYQHELVDNLAPGEYYQPALGPIEEAAYGQGNFGF